VRIERIEEGKAGRVVIHLSSGLSFPLGKKESRNLELEVGKELFEEQISWILEELVFPRGRNYLIYLLSQKDYTCKEIADKLKKAQYPSDVIDQVLSYGLEKHYLDDFRYAEDYVRTHKTGKSIRQLIYKLSEKGISPTILNQLEAEDDWEELLPKVQRYYEKKAGSSYERRGKTYQYFVRKGYSSGLIRDLIREVEEDVDIS
jgi:regulatory protein